MQKEGSDFLKSSIFRWSVRALRWAFIRSMETVDMFHCLFQDTNQKLSNMVAGEKIRKNNSRLFCLQRVADPSSSSLHECDLLNTTGNQLQQKLSQSPFWPPQMQGSELFPQALPAAKRLGTYPHHAHRCTARYVEQNSALTNTNTPLFPLFVPLQAIWIFYHFLQLLSFPLPVHSMSCNPLKTSHYKLCTIPKVSSLSQQIHVPLCNDSFEFARRWYLLLFNLSLVGFIPGTMAPVSPQIGSRTARVYIHSKVEWSS